MDNGQGHDNGGEEENKELERMFVFALYVLLYLNDIGFIAAASPQGEA